MSFHELMTEDFSVLLNGGRGIPRSGAWVAELVRRMKEGEMGRPRLPLGLED